MLDSMRAAANTWAAKVLLGLLVVSFAIWGVAGSFSGYGAGTVAQVGETEVSATEFDRVLRQRIQTIQNQTGQAFTLEQARAIGLPQQVLGEMVANAALADQAREMNIGLSEDKLAQTIATDPAFRGPTGQFDRLRFQQLLRNAGLQEDDYVEQIREDVVRRQLAQALIGGVGAPDPLLKAFYRIQNEERTISFVTVGTGAIEPVADPDEATLQAFFEERTDEFMAPEYRKLGVLVLDEETMADPESVSDEDVAAEYERRREELTMPERRNVEQIRYDSAEAAQAAMDALAAGSSFDDLVAERGLTPADIDLGMKTKAQIVDQDVADAAFAAEEGAVVPVPDARLGPAIIRVGAVEPSQTPALAEVGPRIRDDLATRSARDRVYEVHDQIEDARAGGATLEEAAASLSLPYTVIDAVAADGTAPDGSAVELPAADSMVADAFQSDVGVENDPIRTGGDGFVFYEVLETIPERERSLDEVRDAVAAAWRRGVEAERVSERAQALFDRQQGGATLADIAAEIGASVETRESVRRGGEAAGLSANAVAQAFAGPEGHVANADGTSEAERILLRVDDVIVPAYFAEAGAGLEQVLERTVQEDVLGAYNAELLQSRAPRINNAIYAQLTGAATPN